MLDPPVGLPKNAKGDRSPRTPPVTATLCFELTGQLPFTTLVLHGLIRDSEGRKMSKSLGNTILPEDILYGTPLTNLQQRVSESALPSSEKGLAVENLTKTYPNGIPGVGADALRWALLSQPIKNYDIDFNLSSVEVAKRFTNKLWNAFKFSTANIGDGDVSRAIDNFRLDSAQAPDRWLLASLYQAICDVNDFMQIYEFDKALATLQGLIWHDFCDFYLEYAKPYIWQPASNPHSSVVQSVLLIFLDATLRSLAPFMPFASEELWQRLHLATPCEKMRAKSVHKAEYPEGRHFDRYRNFALVEDGVVVKRMNNIIMSLRNLLGISRKLVIPVSITGPHTERILPLLELISRPQVANVKPVLSGESEIGKRIDVRVSEMYTLNVHFEAEATLDVSDLKPNLDKKIERLEKDVAYFEKKLGYGNEQKSWKKVDVEILRGKLGEAQEKLEAARTLRDSIL